MTKLGIELIRRCIT